MLEYKKGNIFLTDATIISHGCNCLGAFNAGIAKQIRHLFPSAYNAYIQKNNSEGWKLGDVQMVEIPEQRRIIANCATQYGYGYSSKQNIFVDYDAIAVVFKTLVCYSEEHNMKIAMPRIGCGLAGGDWNIVDRILEQVMQGHKANIEVYSL